MYWMKKTVVVDLEYMRPTVPSKARSRSVKRGISNAGSGGEDEDGDIGTLLEKHQTYDGYDGYDGYDDGDHTEDEAETASSSSSSGDSSSPTTTTTAPQRHPSIRDDDYAVDSDEDLLQSVLDEPTFPLDINAILSIMNKTENNTIANMTLKKIAVRRHEILSSLNLTPEKMAEFERKLMMYRVIETPYDLKHNQLIRWIPMRSLETRPYLTLGGTLFRVRENVEEGVHVVTIRNVKRFVFNIKFEVNVVFQRLSREEMLILRAVEFVENDDDDDDSDDDGDTSPSVAVAFNEVKPNPALIL
jgi:hypothetical protein